jgi:hypothetical protein
MSKQKDTLPTIEGPDRVFYETGVLLNAEDFRAEQDYHRGRLARALAYVVGSGTVAGLKVKYQPGVEPGPGDDESAAIEERLMVEPGIAIDRLGRLIEVPRPLCIRLDRWYRAQSDQDLQQGHHPVDRQWPGSAGDVTVDGVVVDLFIKYVPCERGKTPSFAAGPFDSLDAVTASRLRDSCEAQLVIRMENEPLVPENPWPAPQAADDTPASLRNAIYDSWREGTGFKDQDGLVPLAEHAAGQDTTSLFIARIIIPANGAAAGARPVRRKEDSVVINNDLRPFVLSVNALARWLGINLMTGTET